MSRQADGTIVAALNAFYLSRISESGGTPESLGALDSTESARYPQALPGGGRVLVTSAPRGTISFENADLRVVSLKGGPSKTVLRGGYFGRYLPTGHLLYVRQGSIYAVRFA